MCGILGVSTTAGHDIDVAACLRLIHHRGPDGEGTWSDRAAGIHLGHVRLAILDLSDAGAQPMWSGDGQVAIVFNGEIYNFRELRAGLERDGVVFRGHSDTEVLVELYRRMGADMLPRLNGIFALAIHDRGTGELLLARDALGVKPLYVAEHDDAFAFGSEIKALLPLLAQGGGLDPATFALDPAALMRYVNFLWCPGDGTPLRLVRKLEPGTAMVVARGKVLRRWTWYELPARRGVTGSLGGNASIQVASDALRTAVHRQLVADVPVGAFLSGGLDSSAIAAFATERVPGLRCFTISTSGGRDVGEVDDLPYARRVATHLGVPLDVVEVDSSRIAADLPAMIAQLDEPLADPAPLNVLYIARLAREQGIKVLLSGTGGDDVFTGYRRHVALRYEGAWKWLPASVRQRLPHLFAGVDQRTGFGRRLTRVLSTVALEPEQRLAGYLSWSSRADLMELFTPAYVAQVNAGELERPIIEFLAGIPDKVSPIERMLALEQRFFLADHNLLYTDKMSMAAGVEVRVPFLDLDLVEAAARIPDRFKQRGRIGKWVLKQAMEPYLPRDVIYRPKTGFGAPLRRWIREDLREVLDAHLDVTSLRRRGIFDAAAVTRMRADNDAGRRDTTYTLFSILCIEIWCRRFLDGQPSPMPGPTSPPA